MNEKSSLNLFSSSFFIKKNKEYIYKSENQFVCLKFNRL